VRLIVGLGNPGSRYARTLHNAGFLAVDRLAERIGAREAGIHGGAQWARGAFEGAAVTLIKPVEYMNRSGEAVRGAMGRLGVTPERLLVIHDDIDIAAGQARYKVGGGHAGHNGIRSIIESLGAADFHRIRVGVGRPPEGMDAADYVLSAAGPEARARLDAALEAALDLALSRFLGRASGG